MSNGKGLEMNQMASLTRISIPELPTEGTKGMSLRPSHAHISDLRSWRWWQSFACGWTSRTESKKSKIVSSPDAPPWVSSIELPDERGLWNPSNNQFPFKTKAGLNE
jgi:hypothetical protein